MENNNSSPLTAAQTALGSMVSFFASVRDTDPTAQLTLAAILDDIRAGRWRDEIEAARRCLARQDERGYNEAKRKLPAVTLSGAFVCRDAQTPLAAKFVSHSGVLQCDFDRKDNPQMGKPEETIALLRDDPHALFVFVSPSGDGVKAGVLVTIDAEDADGMAAQHALAFAAAENYFLEKYALQIDKATKDPIRLCFMSADADLVTRQDATPLPVVVAPPSAPAREPLWSPPLETTSEDIREMLKFVPPRPDYADWLRIASAVWSVLPMEDGCRLLAEWSPEEKPGEYASKWRHKLSHVGVGTLVWYASQNGFDAKAAVRRKRWAGRIRFGDAPERAEKADTGSDPAEGIKHVELTREFLMTCFEEAQLGDAKLWAARVGGLKLYDHFTQCWRTYNSGVWDKDDVSETLVEACNAIAESYALLIKTIEKDIMAQPAPAGKKDARHQLIAKIEAKQAKLRQSYYMSGVMTFAKSLLATKATFFDQAPHLLCVQNGTIDFTAGVFREHRASDMLTHKSRVVFDENAQCPKWLAFLNWTMGGDKELISYLARFVGYSLTGFVDQDVLAFHHGGGANGKSTAIQVVQLLAGGLSTTINIDALLTTKSDATFDYKKAMLEGKRFVTTDEIPENRTLNDAAIKALVGGDNIVARRPYEKSYTFAPTHKLWLVGNHKPDIKGVDHGIWRRIHLIPWLITIPEEKRRPRHEVLADFRAELPGILNWALRGYIDLVDNGGLRPPAKVMDATNEYKSASDQLAQFLEERTEKEEVAYGGFGRVLVKKLLHAYLAWCEDNGESPRYRSSRALTSALRERKMAVGKDRNGIAEVLGIKLNNAEFAGGGE